jgi:hypothetical protein
MAWLRAERSRRDHIVPLVEVGGQKARERIRIALDGYPATWSGWVGRAGTIRARSQKATLFPHRPQ